MLSDAELGRLTPEQLKLLSRLSENRRFNRFDFWQPFPMQSAFIALGKECGERCLFAGNQVGKSETGAYEATAHLTGLYPADWKGHRFEKPVEGWACGVTNETVRDVIQAKLCGKPGVTEEFGTGMIPKHLFVGKPSMQRNGVADAYDTISVRHKSGGVSQLWFKAYAQQRERFQGPPRDFVWFDEEPPSSIYSEGLARLTSRRGISWLTFTPLLALSEVVLRFTKDQGIGLDWHGAVVGGRGSVRMDFLDNPNYTQEDYERKKREYLPHEWDARLHGLPVLGAGRVWPFETDMITVEPFDVPLHWRKLWGCDFGINEHHPFAGVLTAWDQENDIFYAIAGFKIADAYPWMHAERFRTMGGGIPIAWPHDGHSRAKSVGTGEELHHSYKQLGLPMLPSHATWPEGGYETERAVLEVSQRIVSGRFKVFSSFRQFLDEYLQYHRDEKTFQLVKKRDDLISATFKALMDRRHGKPGPIGAVPYLTPTHSRQSKVRKIGAFNLFTGEPE